MIYLSIKFLNKIFKNDINFKLKIRVKLLIIRFIYLSFYIIIFITTIIYWNLLIILLIYLSCFYQWIIQKENKIFYFDFEIYQY